MTKKSISIKQIIGVAAIALLIPIAALTAIKLSQSDNVALNAGKQSQASSCEDLKKKYESILNDKHSTASAAEKQSKYEAAVKSACGKRPDCNFVASPLNCISKSTVTIVSQQLYADDTTNKKGQYNLSDAKKISSTLVQSGKEAQNPLFIYVVNFNNPNDYEIIKDTLRISFHHGNFRVVDMDSVCEKGESTGDENVGNVKCDISNLAGKASGKFAIRFALKENADLGRYDFNGFLKNNYTKNAFSFSGQVVTISNTCGVLKFSTVDKSKCNYTTSSIGYKSASYQCNNGFEGAVANTSCVTKEALNTAAVEACKTQCNSEASPTPTPTTTQLPTSNPLNIKTEYYFNETANTAGHYYLDRPIFNNLTANQIFVLYFLTDNNQGIVEFTLNYDPNIAEKVDLDDCPNANVTLGKITCSVNRRRFAFRFKIKPNVTSGQFAGSFIYGNNTGIVNFSKTIQP